MPVDHLTGACKDHARNPEHPRGLHDLIRPDHVIRHKVRNEVVAIFGRSSPWELCIVRRCRKVNNRIRSGRGFAKDLHIRERRDDRLIGR